jgi:hypothetical protein
MRNSMKAAAPGIGGVFAAAGSALCCAGEAVRGPRRETQDEDHAMDSHDRRGRVRNVPQLAGALLVRTEGR